MGSCWSIRSDERRIIARGMIYGAAVSMIFLLSCQVVVEFPSPRHPPLVRWRFDFKMLCLLFQYLLVAMHFTVELFRGFFMYQYEVCSCL